MGRKIAIIGDVHGRVNWEYIPHLLSKYDQIVFMGDYLDPYGGRTSYEETWKSFQQVLALKSAYPEKVICLFGNHDQHYLNESSWGRGSRYDRWMQEHYSLDETFHKLLKERVLQLAYHVPDTDILCIHAGLSHFWYNLYILKKGWDVAAKEPVISIKPHDPKAVKELADQLNSFTDYSFLGFQDTSYDVYGYNYHQGFLWWRCMTEWGMGLQEDEMLGGFTQVMGHTQIAKLLDVKGEHRDVRGVFVDGLGSGWYTELNIEDSGDYGFTQVNIPEEGVKQF